MSLRSFMVHFICTFLFAGCIERESEISLHYQNNTKRTVDVFTFPGDPFSSSPDTNWFKLYPSDEIRVLTTSVRGSAAPENIFPSFASTDSCVVIYSDSLIVTHFTRFYSLDRDTISEDVIAFDDSRNIFNQDHFDIEKIGDNQFKATYHFSEEDVDYAISINE